MYTGSVVTDPAISREVARFLHLSAPLTPRDPTALPRLRDGWWKCKRDYRDFEQDYWTARYTAEADPDATPAEREQARADAEAALGSMAAAETEARLIESEAQRVKPVPTPHIERRPVVPIRSAPRSRERRERSHTARRSSSSSDDPGGDDPEPEGVRQHELVTEAR